MLTLRAASRGVKADRADRERITGILTWIILVGAAIGITLALVNRL